MFAVVSMRSLSIALIGGSVFVEDLKFTTKNTHLQVEKCSLRVRYWLRKHRTPAPQDVGRTVLGDRPVGQIATKSRFAANVKGVNYVILNNR